MRETLTSSKNLIYTIVGIFILLGMWTILHMSGWFSPAILPSLLDVIKSYKELVTKDLLIGNTFYSIKLNGLGYLEAIVISLPLGFVLGLSPTFSGLFNKPVNAIRFVPLTAVTGLFITWFGIQDFMKINFLAFGILVYLLPVTIERVRQVEQVFVDTAQTLGATSWQTVRTVFIPAVLSKLFDDIRILTAISWTYIIIAELINRTGGIGSIIYVAGRQSRIDKVFAALFLIVIIGVLQDRLFVLMDKIFFPFKYKGEKR